MVMARAIQLTIVTRVGLLLINRSKTNMVSPAFITIHPVMVQSTDIVNKGRIMDNSITDVRIISSCTLPKLATNENNDDNLEGRKATIILARPRSGRWHQVRQHLSGIGHAIIGDSTHGGSRTNRLWKRDRKLMKERTCLHLCRVQLPATGFSPELDVTCPLSNDLMDMLNEMPDFLNEARTILSEEGINI